MKALSILMASAALTGSTALMLVAAPGSALAQEATVFHACYVPSSGTVYRIKEPGLRQECGTSTRDGRTEQHVQFDWLGGVEGAKGPPAGAKTIEHGDLTGLGDDDHPQYVAVDGVRTNLTTGFALRSAPGSPSPLPVFPAAADAVPTLLWHAGKGALRAGGVGGPTTVPGAWHDANIGQFSIALGRNVGAAGAGALALGNNASAVGHEAIALGNPARAIGTGSFALRGTAFGADAVALQGSASGDASISIGRGAHTNLKSEAVVIATNGGGSLVSAQANNQFVASASSFWLGSGNAVTATPFRLIETSTGAYLSTGGAWVTVSDSTKKTAFAEIDPEDVLSRVARLHIRTWSYTDEGPTVRHLGPTAQAFHGAFGLGDTDRAIAGVDADGVSLAAIQALEKRTAGIATLTQEVAVQRDRIRDLEAVVDALRSELARLRTQVMPSGSR
ncbi:MAG TPA: tail fiber domain-containing protein [Gemmatimonadaceae bacterium]|nr:tail fiber domain-containing protein [Gemmatimonadaceae bacterium]